AAAAGGDRQPDDERQEARSSRARRHGRTGWKLLDLAPGDEFIERHVDQARSHQNRLNRNAGLSARWLASAENSINPVTAMPASPTMAKVRVRASNRPGAVAARPPSRRTSITATAPAKKTSETICPTLANG